MKLSHKSAQGGIMVVPKEIITQGMGENKVVLSGVITHFPGGNMVVLSEGITQLLSIAQFPC